MFHEVLNNFDVKKNGLKKFDWDWSHFKRFIKLDATLHNPFWFG